MLSRQIDTDLFKTNTQTPFQGISHIGEKNLNTDENTANPRRLTKRFLKQPVEFLMANEAREYQQLCLKLNEAKDELYESYTNINGFMLSSFIALGLIGGITIAAHAQHKALIPVILFGLLFASFLSGGLFCHLVHKLFPSMTWFKNYSRLKKKKEVLHEQCESLCHKIHKTLKKQSNQNILMQQLEDYKKQTYSILDEDILNEFNGFNEIEQAMYACFNSKLKTAPIDMLMSFSNLNARLRDFHYTTRITRKEEKKTTEFFKQRLHSNSKGKASDYLDCL